jgi:hypothetical protein
MKQIKTCIIIVAAFFSTQAHAITQIYMPDYWPTITGSNALIKHISTDFYPALIGTVPLITQYSKSGTTQLKKDFTLVNGSYVWSDTWYMKRAASKLIEFRDDYPTPTGTQALVYEPGKEINWGGTYTIGQESSFSVVADPAQSIGLNATDPWRYAFHHFKLENILPTFTTGGSTYSNVAVMYHYQIVCVDTQCNYVNGPQSAKFYEIRFWLAPQKGIVQTQYIYVSDGGENRNGRVDYVSKMCTGPNTQYYCPN